MTKQKKTKRAQLRNRTQNKRSVSKARTYKGGQNVMTNQKRTFKYLKCSPKPVGQKHVAERTCYSIEDLMRLKNAWNKRNPTNQIVSTKQPELWAEMKTKFGNTCSNEKCWYKQFADVNDIERINELFAPTSPSSWKSNPNEWLSSSDISAVMKQYMKIYKCFQFYGPAPIDFDKVIKKTCVENSLCHFNLKHLMENGKFKIGICFNTDPHDKNGEHWISMFVNIRKGIIFFFDSAGNTAPPQVMQLVERVIQQGKELRPSIEFKFDQNYPKQHQYSSTECGMYSLYFMVSMLEDKLTQKYLKTHIITDKHMTKLRKIYYNQGGEAPQQQA